MRTDGNGVILPLDISFPHCLRTTHALTEAEQEAIYRRPRDHNVRGLFIVGPQLAQLWYFYLVVTYCREAPLSRESALAQPKIKQQRRWRRQYPTHDMRALVRELNP